MLITKIIIDNVNYKNMNANCKFKKYKNNKMN